MNCDSIALAAGVAWHGTTDNGGNFVNAVREELGHQHTRCFDHTIQLVVNKALEQFEAVLGKGKAIVSAFHRSSDAATALKHAQQIKKEPVRSFWLNHIDLPRLNTLCSAGGRAQGLGAYTVEFDVVHD